MIAILRGSAFRPDFPEAGFFPFPDNQEFY